MIVTPVEEIAVAHLGNEITQVNALEFDVKGACVFHGVARGALIVETFRDA